jgi:hypothetical protein
LCSHFTLQAKPYQRADYSHSTTKLMKIAHDNQLLVKRLTSISHKVRHVAAQPPSSAELHIPAAHCGFNRASPTVHPFDLSQR